MILIQNYGVAILFTVLAMICWGSWANTQKIAEKSWRFELFYWDLVLGLLFASLVAAYTLGSMGDIGRSFHEDLANADINSILYAFAGGVLWNIGNILLVAAIAIAGMSVAFPIGGGIAWILGIIINYTLVVLAGQVPSNKPVVLWAGVLIIIVAIILSGKAFKKVAIAQKKPTAKGIGLSVIAGVFIAFFYGFVVKSLDGQFVSGGTGNLTPFTAIVFFTVGILVSTVFINPIFMRYPIQGSPVKMSLYWKGSFREHISGFLGGVIWMSGMVVSFMATGAANPAIAYALSNGAPIVAILWGLFVWKEFAGAPKGTNKLLVIMFAGYIVGLILITISNM